jgi:hypothetical protein
MCYRGPQSYYTTRQLRPYFRVEDGLAAKYLEIVNTYATQGPVEPGLSVSAGHVTIGTFGCDEEVRRYRSRRGGCRHTGCCQFVPNLLFHLLWADTMVDIGLGVHEVGRDKLDQVFEGGVVTALI